MTYSGFKDIFGDRVFEFKTNYSFDNLKPSIQKSFLKIILNCPSENVSHLSKNFHSRGIKSKVDYENEITKIQDLIKIQASHYIARTSFMDEKRIQILLKCFNRKPFVYIKKEKNHLDTFYKHLRNGIAHGHIFIENKFITIWTTSINNNINSIFHFKLSSLDKIASTL